jgi:hypothetical protein
MGDWFKNWCGINKPVVVGIICVVVIGAPIMYWVSKAVDNFQAANRQIIARNNASNCQGQWRTIECYQFKIDQLKLEQSYQEVLNAKQPGKSAN